jgi:hypothetical protein
MLHDRQLGRFLRNTTAMPSGCVVWTGATNAAGYGLALAGGAYVLAHRRAWELYRGPLLSTQVVMHLCDNPPCVNPEHLCPGTRGENTQDAAGKGRMGRHSIKVTQLRERFPGDDITTLPAVRIPASVLAKLQARRGGLTLDAALAEALLRGLSG